MTQPVSSVTAVLPKDTVYTVNDSDVKVVDGRPSLLVDEIVSTDNSASGSDYRGVLVDKAVKLVGEGFQNVATQAKYLDLVDAANGNTWIQTDSNVTIYWPYPQGTDANTKFRLVHFDGLDREMTADEVMDAINKNEPVVVKDLVTDQYGIRFETDSFSPFVLVWDKRCARHAERKPGPSGTLPGSYDGCWLRNGAVLPIVGFMTLPTPRHPETLLHILYAAKRFFFSI